MWETVFEYATGEVVVEGSQELGDDDVYVFFGHKIDKQNKYSTSTSVANKIEAKVFFYNELKLKLGGSWLIMDTIIRKEVERFHDKMKAIEQQIPAAIVAKYEEILGPLGDINQEVLDAAAKELKIICDSWYKEKQ